MRVKYVVRDPGQRWFAPMGTNVFAAAMEACGVIWGDAIERPDIVVVCEDPNGIPEHEEGDFRKILFRCLDTYSPAKPQGWIPKATWLPSVRGIHSNVFTLCALPWEVYQSGAFDTFGRCHNRRFEPRSDERTVRAACMMTCDYGDLTLPKQHRRKLLDEMARIESLQGIIIAANGAPWCRAWNMANELSVLSKSDTAICPEGVTDISWRDFAAMISGCVLIKPRAVCSHDLYEYATIIEAGHDWKRLQEAIDLGIQTAHRRRKELDDRARCLRQRYDVVWPLAQRAAELCKNAMSDVGSICSGAV